MFSNAFYDFRQKTKCTISIRQRTEAVKLATLPEPEGSCRTMKFANESNTRDGKWCAIGREEWDRTPIYGISGCHSTTPI